MSSSKIVVSPAGVFRGVRFSFLWGGMKNELPLNACVGGYENIGAKNRDTQREHSSKTLKHSIVKRILVFKR